MVLEVLNHLWQSTLFALCIALLCYLLRKDGAHVRYWLWWIASVKFLVPFSLLVGIGSRLAELGSVAAVPEAWTNTMTVVARPFGTDTAAWLPGVVLLVVWAAGFVLILSSWLIRAARLRGTLLRADRDPAPIVDGRHTVRVYRTAERIEPGAVGILGSALLLPKGLEDRLGARRLDAVIEHELCHLRRRDNLTAAVHMLVEAAFWFHPFVWWIGAKLIDERERACDEMVVALGHDRETYAASILDVCEHYAASPLRCAAGISGSDLKRRITQIMRYSGMNSLRLSKKLILGAAALFALSLPIIAGLIVQKPAFAQDRELEGQDGEYLPIVKVAPVYPPRAVERGLEGYVIVEYTVTATGSTDDLEVVESSSSLFDEAAIASASKYKYKPRILNGEPIEVPGVRTRIIFQLQGGAVPVNPTDDTDRESTQAPQRQ